MTDVTDYQQAGADLPDEAFLGQLVFFTISEADVSLETMAKEVDDRQLRTDTLKTRVRPVDAFKKAVNEVAVKFQKQPGAQHSILVRPVGQDSQTSHRHIVLERAVFGLGKRRHLVYDPLATVVYDRGERQKDGTVANDNITATVNQALGAYALNAEEQAWVDAHIGPDGARLVDRYQHWSTHLDSHAVRAFVREYIYTLGGVQAKANGGVYFVPQKHAEELQHLSELVQAVGSEMHLVPLLDIVNQREFLGRAFEQEAIREVESLMAEFSRILTNQSRTITKATYDEYVNETAALMARLNDYTALLDDNLDHARIQVEVVMRQVLTLAERIKVPKRMRT